jgi:hypothetical protein
MRTRKFLFAFVVTLYWATTFVAAQEQAPAPAFKEGDTWQYVITRKGGAATSTEFLDGTYEITFTQGALKAYEVNGTEKRDIPERPDRRPLLGLLGGSEERPSLKFPLSVGQKWTYEYRMRLPGAKNEQTRSVEVNVPGIEQVVTPAGSFKAYKLVREESWTILGGQGRKGGPSRMGNTTTYFYSPETRSTVKSITEGDRDFQATIETELIKFTPGN